MLADIPPADDLQNYHVARNAVTFYGQQYDLQPTRVELSRIWGECEPQIRTTYRNLRQEEAR